MRKSLNVVSIANFLLAVLSVLGKCAETQNPQLFDSPWATLVALFVCGFLVTWMCAGVGAVIYVCVGGTGLSGLVYLWLLLAGAIIAWLAVGFVRFAFPNSVPWAGLSYCTNTGWSQCCCAAALPVVRA